MPRLHWATPSLYTVMSHVTCTKIPEHLEAECRDRSPDNMNNCAQHEQYLTIAILYIIYPQPSSTGIKIQNAEVKTEVGTGRWQEQSYLKTQTLSWWPITLTLSIVATIKFSFMILHPYFQAPLLTPVARYHLKNSMKKCMTKIRRQL